MAVLWIIALLIMLVGGASLLLLQDVDMATTRSQIFRARMLAESGLAIAMNPDVRPGDPILRQQVAPEEAFAVEITGEDGRLNPNVLLQREDRDTLRRVFNYWGLPMLEADAVIDSLLDWVDADDFNRIRGAESKAYGRTGFPFNRPFRSIEEMALVRGMQEVEAVYPRWRDWFSVYASGMLDLNEAEPEIISALTGADIRMAQQLRSRRIGMDGLLNTEDDAPMPDLVTALSVLGLPNSQSQNWQAILTVTSSTRRIISRAKVGDLERTVGLILRGSPNQGAAIGRSSILWMGER